MKTENFDFETVFYQARSGDSVALGDLLENYRNYLLFLARLQIDSRICGKLDGADLVQETFLNAYQAFPDFRGENETTFLAWLRQILASTLAMAVRRYVGTKQRDVRLEREIYVRVDQSSIFWNQLVGDVSTPSLKVSRKEMETRLLQAISQLPEHYQEALRLRHSEGLPFQEIARRMGRTVDSVQKIWVRALAQLRELVNADE